MKERRRSQRYDLVIPVVINSAHGVFKTKTVNASFHGVAVHADNKMMTGSYAELELALPDGRIVSVTAVATRNAESLEDPSGGKGSGIAFEFYLFDAQGREAWSALMDRLGGVAVRRASADAATEHAVRVGPAKTSKPASIVRRGKDDPSGPVMFSVPPSRPPPAIEELPTFLIKPRDVERLRAFQKSELADGRVRIETPVLKPVGSKVELVVVHPTTSAEWSMHGHVASASETGRGRGPMLEIAVPDMSEEEVARFRGFVSHGRASRFDPAAREPVRVPLAQPHMPPPRSSAPPAKPISIPAPSLSTPDPLLSSVPPPPLAPVPPMGTVPPPIFPVHDEPMAPTEVLQAYRPQGTEPDSPPVDFSIQTGEHSVGFDEGEEREELPIIALPPSTPLLSLSRTVSDGPSGMSSQTEQDVAGPLVVRPSTPTQESGEISADELSADEITDEGEKAKLSVEEITDEGEDAKLDANETTDEGEKAKLGVEEITDEGEDAKLDANETTDEGEDAKLGASETTDEQPSAAEAIDEGPTRESEPPPEAIASSPAPKRPSFGPDLPEEERARRREAVRSKPFASFFQEFMPEALNDSSEETARPIADDPPPAAVVPPPPPATPDPVSAQSLTVSEEVDVAKLVASVKDTAESDIVSFDEVEETRREHDAEEVAALSAALDGRAGTAGAGPKLSLEEARTLDEDIEVARKRVDKRPENVTAVFKLGRLLVRRGSPQEALDFLTRVVSLEPNHPAAHHAAAEVLVELGQFDSAAEHLRKARRLGYQIDHELEKQINSRRA